MMAKQTRQKICFTDHSLQQTDNMKSGFGFQNLTLVFNSCLHEAEKFASHTGQDQYYQKLSVAETETLCMLLRHTGPDVSL